nr:hypothetical protein CFP56_72144 [Quercus suber]
MDVDDAQVTTPIIPSLGNTCITSLCFWNNWKICHILPTGLHASVTLKSASKAMLPCSTLSTVQYWIFDGLIARQDPGTNATQPTLQSLRVMPSTATGNVSPQLQ